MRGKLPLQALMSRVKSNISSLADGALGRKGLCLGGSAVSTCVAGTPDHERRHTEPTQLTYSLEAVRECTEYA